MATTNQLIREFETVLGKLPAAAKVLTARQIANQQLFLLAHADARHVVAEQIAMKHPSAHRSYAEIFASVLRGQAIIRAGRMGGYKARSCVTLTHAQREQIGA